METIDRIVDHAARIAAGVNERVAPGQPAAFTEGCAAGDTIAQGDLYLVLLDAVPEGSVRVENPSP